MCGVAMIDEEWIEDEDIDEDDVILRQCDCANCMNCLGFSSADFA